MGYLIDRKIRHCRASRAVNRGLGRLRVPYTHGRPGARHPALHPLHLRETGLSHLRDRHRSFWSDRVPSPASDSAPYEVRLFKNQGVTDRLDGNTPHVKWTR